MALAVAKARSTHLPMFQCCRVLPTAIAKVDHYHSALHKCILSDSVNGAELNGSVKRDQSSPKIYGKDRDMPAIFGGMTSMVGCTIHWMVPTDSALAESYYFYEKPVKYTMFEYTLRNIYVRLCKHDFWYFFENILIIEKAKYRQGKKAIN